jgi:hypothetical protein
MRKHRAQHRRTRPSDVAPRRYGDGIKPDHAARAVDIRRVFPVVAIKAETADRHARNLLRRIADKIAGKS